MIETFGVPDYAPDPHYGTDDVRSAVESVRDELIGASFDGAWLMWDFAEDTWVDDGPTIVCLANHQLEICFGDAQDVYVTVDEIDRKRPLAWFDDRNRPYQWVSNPVRGFQSLSFRQLERIGVGETGWSSGGVASYQPTSIELDFGSAHLAIERAEPTNVLRFDSPRRGDGFRVVWL
jgi:hypothetical protein